MLEAYIGKLIRWAHNGGVGPSAETRMYDGVCVGVVPAGKPARGVLARHAATVRASDIAKGNRLLVRGVDGVYRLAPEHLCCVVHQRTPEKKPAARRFLRKPGIP